MAQNSAQLSNETDDKQQTKFRSSDMNLNGELLRIQAVACAKQIISIWYLDQSNICNFFQKYNRLPLSRVQAGQLITSQGTRIIKNQNKIYLGQVLHKKKHGKGSLFVISGIAIYKDGRIYQGQFAENEKSGYGVELYANGNLFVGQFSQNKKHGKGSFYWFSLCTPACTKEAAVKIQQYHGDWWGGLPDGEGQHQKANGDFYVGGFKNGLKHGEGVQYYANGDLYKGQFINGLAEGYGQYAWADGSIYKGDFKQGYRNGYGIWESKNSKQQYKGHYLLDRKHGFGIYDWGNNIIYKGQYLEDMRTGHGQLYRNGQLVYSGMWQNGERLEIFQSKFTPQKKKQKSLSKSNEKDNFGASSNINFRVKTTKLKYKSAERRNSTATVKKDNFQVNFKLLDSSVSTHRGCAACCKRPSTGAAANSRSQKFRRRNRNFQNPQQCAH